VTRKRDQIAALLRQRFFSGLHLGLLQPGGRLPSARDLAAELNVDRRVVLEAYRALENEGLVELRPRSGIFFSRAAPGLPGGPLSPPAGWAVDVIAKALERGISPTQFADRFHGYLSTLRLRAACIECNTDQVSALCSELADDYGLDTSGLDVEELLAEESPRAELRRSDLLVTTPFHAREVQEIAARVKRPWIAVSVRTDVYAEIARLLPRMAVYFVVLDARYAAKLDKIFANMEGSSNFRSLVHDHDDLALIPSAAPVYITRAARARLSDSRPELALLLQRVMPEDRQFSAESAREILSFIVAANMTTLTSKR